jgi:hypothetical protein
MNNVLRWLDVAACLGLGLLLFTNLPWNARTAAGLALVLSPADHVPKRRSHRSGCRELKSRLPPSRPGNGEGNRG